MKKIYGKGVGNKYPRKDWVPSPCSIDQGPNDYVVEKVQTVLSQGARQSDDLGLLILQEVEKHGMMTLARAKELWNQSHYRMLLGRCYPRRRDETMIFTAMG